VIVVSSDSVVCGDSGSVSDTLEIAHHYLLVYQRSAA
jgi:hypothetical protein